MDTIPYKVCCACNQSFPATKQYFYAHAQMGLHPRCKGCHGKGKQPRQPRWKDGERRCGACKEYLPPECFNTLNTSPDTLAYSCRECANKVDVKHRRKKGQQPQKPANPLTRYERDPTYWKARAKAYQQAKPEVHKKANRRYRATEHGRLAHLLTEQRRRTTNAAADGWYTEEDLHYLYLLQAGRCVYCRRKIGNEPPHKYTIEHIIPLKRGGSNRLENILLICSPCNSSKGSKLLSEWTPRVRFLD